MAHRVQQSGCLPHMQWTCENKDSNPLSSEEYLNSKHIKTSSTTLKMNVSEVTSWKTILQNRIIHKAQPQRLMKYTHGIK